MKITIVARTLAGQYKELRCIGALAENGVNLRLLSDTGDRFHPADTPFHIGDIWEVDFEKSPNIIPPHLEDVIITSQRKIGKQSDILNYIETIGRPLYGGFRNIFDGTLRRRNEVLFVAEKGTLPTCSTCFWGSNKNLDRVVDDYGIRYVFQSTMGLTYSIRYVGDLDEKYQIHTIPSGAIIRFSLSGLFQSYKTTAFWLQLSGWYLK